MTWSHTREVPGVHRFLEKHTFMTFIHVRERKVGLNIFKDFNKRVDAIDRDAGCFDASFHPSGLGTVYVCCVPAGCRVITTQRCIAMGFVTCVVCLLDVV